VAAAVPPDGGLAADPPDFEVAAAAWYNRSKSVGLPEASAVDRESFAPGPAGAAAPPA